MISLNYPILYKVVMKMKITLMVNSSHCPCYAHFPPRFSINLLNSPKYSLFYLTTLLLSLCSYHNRMAHFYFFRMISALWGNLCCYPVSLQQLIRTSNRLSGLVCIHPSLASPVGSSVDFYLTKGSEHFFLHHV